MIAAKTPCWKCQSERRWFTDRAVFCANCYIVLAILDKKPR